LLARSAFFTVQIDEQKGDPMSACDELPPPGQKGTLEAVLQAQDRATARAITTDGRVITIEYYQHPYNRANDFHLWYEEKEAPTPDDIHLSFLADQDEMAGTFMERYSLDVGAPVWERVL
jgi:hypothetical protein